MMIIASSKCSYCNCFVQLLIDECPRVINRPDFAKDMGFHGAKFPLPFGPAQGQEGMRKNIEMVKKWREIVGEDYPLMIDCYMSLTVPYAIELARRCEPYNIKWIEETLPPDEYEGYARIKEKVCSTLLTTGEHEYTRYGFRMLLEKKCCDVLQPDITCKSLRTQKCYDAHFND